MYKHRHIKRWGQVFLRNVNIQRKIANYINNLGCKNMLEIGPGSGCLTRHIDHANRNLVLVEIDRKLVALLSEKFPNLGIISDDFLRLNCDAIFPSDGSKRILFGNLPYYIVSPIIFKFFRENFDEAIFMVQREYYESMVSCHTDKNYSSLSVLCNSLVTIIKVMDVGRSNFFPVPKVDSVVIHLIKRDTDLYGDLDGFMAFLRWTFFMPRKTIWNNWRRVIGEEDIEIILGEHDLDRKIRPDSIPIETYGRIFLSESWKRAQKSINSN